MDAITILTINFLAVLGMMVLGWLVSLIYRNVTIVDSLWGLGFVLIAWLAFFMADGFFGRKLLVAVLVTLWGVRLSLHLSWRNWGKGEDPRYGAWRKKSGDRFWLVSLFKIFVLQAIFLWAIALALQWAQLQPRPGAFTAWDAIGIILWTIGFFFEAVGDWQLARFKADPANKGRVMERGAVGLFTPSQLFRRKPGLVGNFLYCPVHAGKRMDGDPSDPHHPGAVENDRDPVDGKSHRSPPAGLCGLHRANARLCPVVPKEKEIVMSVGLAMAESGCGTFHHGAGHRRATPKPVLSPKWPGAPSPSRPERPTSSTTNCRRPFLKRYWGDT